MKTSYTENLEVKQAPQESIADFFRIRLRISVFYGKTFPLFVTAFRDVLSLPSTAKLQIVRAYRVVRLRRHTIESLSR